MQKILCRGGRAVVTVNQKEVGMDALSLQIKLRICLEDLRSFSSRFLSRSNLVGKLTFTVPALNSVVDSDPVGSAPFWRMRIRNPFQQNLHNIQQILKI